MPNQRITIDMRMLHASGIGIYLANLVPLVMELLPHCRFSLIGNPEELAPIAAGQARAEVIPCTVPIYSVSEQLEIRRITPADSAVFWSPHYNIPLFCKARLLVTVHDVFHLSMSHYLKGAHQRIYAKVMFHTIMRKAAAILCPSKYTVTELIRMTGYRRDNIHVTYNAVDPAWFEVERQAPLRERPYLLFVGNVKPHKNLKGLIQAFETLRDTIGHDLVIVGKKEGFITADDDTLTRAGSGRIMFTGYVEDSELRRYVAHADALILPSFYEGFGIPPIEAMACGCPTIVSACSSLPEVCRDAALYCNPYDHLDIAARITELLLDRELRDEMAAKGRRHAQQFTWQASAATTARVISDMLER
jgi:glycosyltransferase involved in cell wall biosynthesis